MNWLPEMIKDQTLLLMSVTLMAYVIGISIYDRFNRTPFLHPVLIGMIVVNVMLGALSLDYESYFDKNKVFHLLLGPAVVSLAVPIYEHLGRAKETILPLLLSIVVCGLLIALSTVVVAHIIGLDVEMVKALITRSVTAPISLAIAEKVDVNTGLVILVVFLTGLFSVVASPYIFRLLNIDDDAVKGFTLGLTAHTFGVARALEISSQAAAFATLAMGLTGCLAAFVLPFILIHYKP